MQAWSPNDSVLSPIQSWPGEPYQDLLSSREFSPFVTSPDFPGDLDPIPEDFSWDECASDERSNLGLNQKTCDQQSAVGEDHVRELKAGSNFALDTSNAVNRASYTVSSPNHHPAGLVPTANSAKEFPTQASSEDEHLAMNSQCLHRNMTSTLNSREVEEQFLAKRECDGCHQSMEGPELNRFFIKRNSRDLLQIPSWCHPREECWIPCMDEVKDNPLMEAELSRLPGNVPSSFSLGPLGRKEYASEQHQQHQQWKGSISLEKWRAASQKKSHRISTHVLCPCAVCKKVIYWGKVIKTPGKRSTVKRPTKDRDMYCSLQCSSKATHES